MTGSKGCTGRTVPSRTGSSRWPDPKVPPRAPPSTSAWAEISRSRDTARRSSSDETPSWSSRAVVVRAAVAGRMAIRRTPLSTIALWNRPRAAGVARSKQTFEPPPDSPKIVTFPRCAEPVALPRRRAVRDALEGADTVHRHPLHGSGGRLDHGTLHAAPPRRHGHDATVLAHRRWTASAGRRVS